jgi:AAA+ ATPase superfamily predicted ATPase
LAAEHLDFKQMKLEANKRNSATKAQRIMERQDKQALNITKDMEKQQNKQEKEAKKAKRNAEKQKKDAVKKVKPKAMKVMPAMKAPRALKA